MKGGYILEEINNVESLTQPANQEVATSGENEDLAVISLVCGILSFVFNILCIIPSLITGYMYRKQPVVSEAGLRQAKAGIICSWVALGLTLCGIVVFLALLLAIPALF